MKEFSMIISKATTNIRWDKSVDSMKLQKFDVLN
jgi:hypothetical protein